MPQLIPVFATWIATTFTISAATATLIATVIVNVAISATLAIISGLLLKQSLNSESQKQVIKQAIPPRRRFYGDVKIGGVWGLLTDQDNILYQVVLLCQGEIDSFITHWFGDEQLGFDGSGNVTTPSRFLRSGVNYANVITYRGTLTQTVDPVLSTHVAGWNANHKGLGIAYARIWLLSPPAASFSTIYPSGMQPYNARIHASKVWDPRDSGQDPDDLTTWAWTQNAVLILMDYVWHSDGMRLPRSMIEDAIEVWAEEADRADESVGGEARWRLSGGYDLSAAPKQILPLMLVPMDAQLYLRGDGAIAVRTGRWETPTVTFSDEHIYAYVGFARGRQPGDLKNEIRANYVSPENNFIEQEAEPYRNEDSIGIDGLQSMTLDLTWVPSHTQARRRMKPELYRQNPAWSGQLITTAYGLKATDQRFIALDIPELAIAGDTFEILRWSFDPMSGRVTFDLISMPEIAWTVTESDGSGSGSEGGPTLDPPTGLASSGQDLGGGNGNLTASVDDPGNPDIVIQFSWSVANEDIWTAFVSNGTTLLWTGYSQFLDPGTYDVRARATAGGYTSSTYVYVYDVDQPY